MRKILRKPLTLVVAVLAVLLALQLMPGVSLLGPGQVSSEGEPQVTTDKPDYEPSETVIITGSGFEASVELTVQITRPDASVDSAGVTSDGEGGFQYDYVLDGICGEYLVEVLDGEENVLASTTFTDCFWPSTLTVTLAGDGSGTVTGTGINCPGDCFESYGGRRWVSLTATPDAGSVFVGWSGACSGTTSPTSVFACGFTYCTATFTLTLLQADLEKIELFASPFGQPEVPLPLDFTVSEETGFHLWDRIINNGPIGPAPAVITTWVTAPAGVQLSYHEYEAVGYPDVQVFLDEGSGFVDVTCGYSCCFHYADPGETLKVLKFMDIPVTQEPQLVPQGWDIHCLEPSDHTIHWENSIALTDDEWEDTESNNDTADLYLPIECWADVDMTVSQEVYLWADGQCTGALPPEIDVSEDLEICVKKTITADVQPPATTQEVPLVRVRVDMTAASLDDGCTITPLSAVNQRIAVNTAEGKVLEEHFTIHCTKPSNHDFTITNVVSGPRDEHINGDGDEDVLPISLDALADVDIGIVSQEVSLWNDLAPPEEKCTTEQLPEQIDVSEDLEVCVKKTLTASVQNDDPYVIPSVNVVVTKEARSLDAGCTILPADPEPAQVEVFTDGGAVHKEHFTIHCTKPSSHDFTIKNVVSGPKDPHINGDGDEDVLPFSLDALAYVDVEITGQVFMLWNEGDCDVAMPDEIDVSADVDVCLVKTIEAPVLNEGEYDIPTVMLWVNKTATAPEDCTITPESVSQAQVEVSTTEPTVHKEMFTIHCAMDSTHGPFSVTNVLTPKDEHVIDADGASSSDDLYVDAIAYADMKVVDQYVADPPAEIWVSEDTEIMLHKVIHNNGPWEPVDAFTTTTVDAPEGCEVRPEVHVQQFWNVPVSVDLLHHEPFTIHCYEQGEYTFTFVDEVELKEVHVRDTVPGNNSKTTELIVDSVEQADVKILSVAFVKPPTKIDQGQDVPLTVHKVIHNNGPVGPVDIAIESTPTAPSGCTAVATDVPILVEDVPISVDVDVYELWTLNCTETGQKAFIFENSIDVATPFVSDCTEENNASRIVLSVPDDPAADTDDDGFLDGLEIYVGTDHLDACPDDLSDDAWPLDIDMDRAVTFTGDVFNYVGKIGATPSSPNWSQRLDLDSDGAITFTGDVFQFVGHIGETCQ